MCARMSSSSSSGRTGEAATTSPVRSSAVGPSPPEVTISATPASAREPQRALEVVRPVADDRDLRHLEPEPHELAGDERAVAVGDRAREQLTTGDDDGRARPLGDGHGPTLGRRTHPACGSHTRPAICASTARCVCQGPRRAPQAGSSSAATASSAAVADSSPIRTASPIGPCSTVSAPTPAERAGPIAHRRPPSGEPPDDQPQVQAVAPGTLRDRAQPGHQPVERPRPQRQARVGVVVQVVGAAAEHHQHVRGPTAQGPLDGQRLADRPVHPVPPAPGHGRPGEQRDRGARLQDHPPVRDRRHAGERVRGEVGRVGGHDVHRRRACSPAPPRPAACGRPERRRGAARGSPPDGRSAAAACR